MAIQTTNPFTGEIEKTFDPISWEEVEKKLEISEKAYKSWKGKSFAQRAELLNKVAELLENRKEQYGEIITREMGKPITASIAEIEKCAWASRYFAENAEKFLSADYVETEYQESFHRYDPLGVIFQVMPWNFPFWQVFRMGVPALMAGNTIVLKHASNVPQSALAIEEIFDEAGSEEKIFQTLLIGSDLVEKVIEYKAVQGVSLTGGDKAGSIVASIAGKNIKKSVMELGGNDAYIILDDAQLEMACSYAVSARLGNAGQVCNSPKRYILHKDIADEAIKKLGELFASYKLGDPMNKDTQMGPLSSEGTFNDVVSQVEKAVAAGAKVLTGGKKSDVGQLFYEPTLLADVSRDNPVYYEEIFGPVTSIYIVNDWKEAVDLANDSIYGLGAAVWTQDLDLAKRMAAQLEAGSIAINEVVKSDPRLTIGGIKRSGFGRELSVAGIREFVNIKSVVIK